MPMRWVALIGFVKANSYREMLMELLHSVAGSNFDFKLPDVSFIETASTSHHERRRAHDRAPPCESTGPLDTNDNDCATHRFNLLGQYYPFHQNLQKLERMVVQGEDEVEGLMSSISKATNEHSDIIFGTRGLKRDMKLLAEAERQLGKAADNVMETFANDQKRISDRALDDSDILPETIDQAFRNLKSATETKATSQELSARANIDSMNHGATMALSASVAGILSRQRDIAKLVRDQGLAQGEVERATDKKMKSFENRGTDVNDKLAHIEASREADRQSLSDQMALAIKETASSFKAHTTPLIKSAGEQLDTLVGSINRRSIDARRAWVQQEQALMRANRQSIAEKVSSADTLIDTSLREELPQLISKTSSNISSTIAVLTTRIEQEQSARSQKFAHDLSRVLSGLSKQTREAVVRIVAAAGRTQPLSEDGQIDLARRIQKIISSGSRTTHTELLSLLRALGDAQADSHERLGTKETTISESAGKFLEEAGSGLFDSSDSISDLYKVLMLATQRDDVRMSSLRPGSVTDLQIADLLREIQSEGGSIKSLCLAGVLGILSNGISRGSSEASEYLKSTNLDFENSVNRLMGSSDHRHIYVTHQTADIRESVASLLRLVDDTGPRESLLEPLLAADSNEFKLFDIANLLASHSDALANSLSQAVSNALQISSSNDSSKLQKMARMLLSKIKAEEGRSISSRDAQATDTWRLRNMIEGRHETIAGLQSVIDASLANYGSKSEVGGERFDQGMGQLSQQDDEIEREAQAAVSGMNEADSGMRAFIGNRNNKVSERITRSLKAIAADGISSSATETSTQLEQLALAVSMGATDISKTESLLTESLAGNAQTRENQQQEAFRRTLHELESSFAVLRRNESFILNGFLSAVNSSIEAIPRSIYDLYSMTDNEFRLSSLAIDDKIVRLREKLALTSSSMEKESLQQDLLLLEKLKAVAQGVSDSDYFLRSDIDRNISTSQAELEHVRRSMNSVIAAISVLSNGEAQATTGDLNLRSTGEATATLIDGLSRLSNETSERLSHDAAQSALAAAFDLKFRKAKTDLQTNTGISITNTSIMTARRDYQITNSEGDQLRAHIDSLNKRGKISAHALDEAIRDILDSVASSKSNLVAESGDQQHDLLTRLGLVRLAMSEFLGLWNQYGSATGRALDRIVLADKESIRLTESHTVTAISQAQARLRSVVDKVNGLHEEVKHDTRALDELQAEFRSSVASQVDSLRAINKGRNERDLVADEGLSAVSDLVSRTDQQMWSAIEAEMSKFDGKLKNS